MPSEHLINGKQYAAELHVVHKRQKTTKNFEDHDIFVTSVLFDFGEASPLLKQLYLDEGDASPPQGFQKYKTIKHPVDLMRSLGPALDGPFYRYNGSYTTPPCWEEVKWIVFETPMTISKAQWLAFK